MMGSTDKDTQIVRLKGQIPKYVFDVAATLASAGYDAYLVGGSLRDLLIGKTPSDFDIATNAKPEDIQALFDKTVATGAKFGTIVVVVQDVAGERFNVEVTTYRIESEYYASRWPSNVEFTTDIKKDLERRDFTINAMAYDLSGQHDDEIVDYFGGMADLKAKVIRAVGDPLERFEEDALRPVRACRLASQLGFSLDLATKESIARVLGMLDDISVERFRDEFVKLLYKSTKPSIGLDLLTQTGIMKIYIPEFVETIGLVQPEYHVDDVYTHTLKVVDNAQDEIKLAAFFHDIGKARTQTKDEKGIHFYQHDIVGAKMAGNIMRRLKFSNKEIENVTLLVKYHMFYYPSADWRKTNAESLDSQAVEELAQQQEESSKIGGWTDAAIRRFLNRVGGIDNLNDLIKLRIADATANPKSTFTNYEIDALQNRVSKVLEEDAALKLSDLDISGDDIMKLGIEKGPRIGQILNQLLERVLDDPKINTKERLEQIIIDEFLSTTSN